jgi:hypothetical protein
VFPVDGAAPLKDVCQRHGLDSRCEHHEAETVSNVSFSRYNDVILCTPTILERRTRHSSRVARLPPSHESVT